MEELNLVRRLNYLGDSVGGANRLISIIPEELIDIARNTTGLNDFGSDNWQVNYYENVKTINSSTNNSTLGLLQLKARLLMALRNRLFITDKIKHKPDILKELIDKPLIITGIERTGTTILFGLLSKGLGFRSVYGFEAACPVEPPEKRLTGGLGQKEIAQCIFDIVMDIQPEIKKIHDHRHDLPVECREIMASTLSGISEPFNTTESYQIWNEKVNNDHLYYWHKISLQVLQHKCPVKPWLLKCPSHIHFLERMLEHYPNALIIHTHRDPVKAIPSYLNALKNLSSVFSKNNDDMMMAKKLVAQSKGSLSRVIKQRQDDIIPKNQITDINFQDLMSDPVATIRAAFDSLGLIFEEGFDRKLLDNLNDMPRNKYGKHNYKSEDFGLTDDEIRKEFIFYTNYYSIAEDM